MADGRRIALYTCLRDEGPYLLDWLAHHLAAGFTEVVVASHDCADGSDAMLGALDRAGVLRHVPFAPSGKRTVQWQALERLWPLVAGADWAAFLDCDEYVNLRQPGGVVALIDGLPEGAEACAVAWRLFGAAGGGLGAAQTAAVRCASPDLPVPTAHFFKTLARPSAFDGPGVHRPKGARAVWADGSGRLLPEAVAAREGRINLFGLTGKNDLVQLNHYAVRTVGAFLLKRARGLPNRSDREVGLGYWAERNWGEVEDRSIVAMAPGTDAIRAELEAIPGVADLHRAAIAHHAAALSRILATEEGARLHWQLTLAGFSRPPSPEIARAHLDRLGAIRDAA